MLGLLLLVIYNYLNMNVQGMISKFVADMKVGGIAYRLPQAVSGNRIVGELGKHFSDGI